MTRSAQPTLRDLLSDGDYFLSSTNPMANRDQRDIEFRALELLELPGIRDATSVARAKFEMLMGKGAPDEARERLDAHMRHWAFWHVATAVNCDANQPRVYRNVFGPSHRWFDTDVPASRGPCTGENADITYGFVPIDPFSRFEVIGQLQDPPIDDCPIYITATMSITGLVSSLQWGEVVFDDDGTFVITVDPFPAAGRPNHLQTAVDARFLYFRDTRQHWSEVLNAYRVRRVDPPLGPPIPREATIALAERLITDNVPLVWMARQAVAHVEANTIAAPANAASVVSGMKTQSVLRGRVSLSSDEAYVLSLNPGSARTSSLASYDWWMVSGDYGNRTTSLNNTQSIAGPDGTTTYVFSSADPGVHNWIDTSGRRETTFVNRWELPAGAGLTAPTATGRLLRRAELAAALPEGTATVTPDQRAEQLAERSALYGTRFRV